MQTNSFVLNINKLILLVMFILPAAVFSSSINNIYIYICLPIVFVYCIFRYLNSLKNKYITLFILLFLWSCICAIINPVDFASSTDALNQMILSILFCYPIIALSGVNDKYIKWFYLLLFSFYAANWILAIFRFDLFSTDITTEQFGGSTVEGKINANRWGYFTLFFTFIAFIYGELCSIRWKRLLRNIFLSTIIIVIFNAIITGSRQVLLLNIPLYFILLVLRYKRQLFRPKVLISVIILIVSIIFLSKSYLLPIYNNSVLRERNIATNLLEETRMQLLVKSINYGIENPLFGIGPANFRQKEIAFSHCSFTEIFAETGFIGLILFTAILFGCLNVQLRRYIKTKDKVFLYFTIYLFFYILDNLFYVFYEWYLLMGMFYLISAHCDSYYKKYYLTKQHYFYN